MYKIHNFLVWPRTNSDRTVSTQSVSKSWKIMSGNFMNFIGFMFLPNLLRCITNFRQVKNSMPTFRQVNQSMPLMGTFWLNFFQIFSSLFYILVCGIWSQFFMIKLISWRIGLVGFGLPWLGFAFGCLFSKLCRYAYLVISQITSSLQDFALGIRKVSPQFLFLN